MHSTKFGMMTTCGEEKILESNQSEPQHGRGGKRDQYTWSNRLTLELSTFAW